MNDENMTHEAPKDSSKTVMTHEELVARQLAFEAALGTLAAEVAALRQDTSRSVQRLHGSQVALTNAVEEIGKVLGTPVPPIRRNPEAN